MPRIEKALFVATKADRCSGDRGNLTYLLDELVGRVYRQLRATVPGTMKCYCCAACRCTEDRVKRGLNGEQGALRGILMEAPDEGPADWAADKRVPDEWPDRWEPGEERFGFPHFYPPLFPARDGAAIPHINLDKVLWFLLEDCLP